MYVCVLVHVCCSVACVFVAVRYCGTDTASEHQSSDVTRIDENVRKAEER